MRFFCYGGNCTESKVDTTLDSMPKLYHFSAGLVFGAPSFLQLTTKGKCFPPKGSCLKFENNSISLKPEVFSSETSSALLSAKREVSFDTI